MKLSSQKQTTNITASDFGDKYKGEEFSFDIDSLSIKEQIIFSEKFDIQGDNTKNSEYISFMEKMFIKTVKVWSGVETESGVLTCNDKNKALLFEHSFDFCKEVMEAAAEKSQEDKKK